MPRATSFLSSLLLLTLSNAFAQDNWTANLGIATMRGEYTTDWNEISAAAVFVAIPIMLIYLFLERYLVGGLTAGAEK